VRRPYDRTPRIPAVFHLGRANFWFCDKCRAYGDAIFDPDVTIVRAVAQIRDAHKLASPLCCGTAFIRLVNLEHLQARGLVA
jgi:prepilin-type processing-associated H-X9-DG protein